MRASARRWLVLVTAVLAASSLPAVTGEALAASSSVTTATSTAAAPATATPTTAAPAVKRYDQTDASLGYSGAWSTVKKSQASSRTYARTNAAGASVNVAFSGTRLDWIATQVSGGGSADLYLDGVCVKTISLAAASTAYQRRMWSTGTLASGMHTLRIVRSASSAAGSYITIDAVDVVGTLLKCQYVGQNSPLLQYQGSTVTASFSGTYLAWVGPKAVATGATGTVPGATTGAATATASAATATVTLDGGQASTVDFSGAGASATASAQQQLWDTGQLASGPHSVKIEWTAAASGGAAPLSAGAAASAAGFLVVGTATQSYVWRAGEDTDARVLYWGTWTTSTDAQASGGTDKRAAAAGSMVTLTFTGQKLYWIATTGPGLGKADVSVDNGAVQVVDLSGATTQYQQRVWSTGLLESGAHTVQISWNKSNAAGTAIDVDVFGVLGDLPATTDVKALKVMWAEQKLESLSYRPGTIDGVIDRRTRGAVIAFEKWEGLPRNGKLDDTVYARLQTATRPKPKK